MIILAVDSSSDRLKLGIADDQRIYAGYDGPDDRSHSEKIITELDTLLATGDINPSTLNCLAVTIGPGSFTGLRVGIATVLGLAQAWKKEILIAGNLMLEKAFSENLGRDSVTVIHCRGDQFYVSSNGSDMAILSAGRIAAQYPGRSFAGPGSARLRKLASDAGVTLDFDSPESVDGGELARLFARNHTRFDKLNPTDLDVNYLLKSQPEQRRDAVKLDYTITDMAESDLVDILTIERESFSDPWDRESFQSDIAGDGVITMVVRRDDHCIGYLSCMALDDYGYIANVAIDGRYRSGGIGHALLDELRRQLLARGTRQMVLDVRASNHRAIRFYERYGFSIITRRRGFYSTPPEDSFTMQLDMDK
jgi:ribosomal-protein-alanine N-acetyltransferase